MSFGPLRAAGKYSYGMYVFHYPLAKVVGPHLFGEAVKAPTLTFGVLYALGVLAGRWLRRKRRCTGGGKT